MDAIAIFVMGSTPNAWIRYMGFEIYVRHGYHSIPGLGCVRTFDLANITLPEKFRGQGRFHTMLHEIERILISRKKAASVIFVESILNPRLELTLGRLGFKHVEEGVVTPCMYREIVR